MLECAKCKPVGSVLLVWKRGQCYLKLPRDTWAGPPQHCGTEAVCPAGEGRAGGGGEQVGGSRSAGGAGGGMGEKLGGWEHVGAGGPSRETAGCRPGRVERSFLWSRTLGRCQQESPGGQGRKDDLRPQGVLLGSQGEGRRR